MKNFEDKELPHELSLTTRQTTKIKNVFANNMLTAIKHSKAQLCKIIQSGRSFGSWLGNLGEKALTNIVILSARGNLTGLVSNLISNTINKFERKIGEKEAVSSKLFGSEKYKWKRSYKSRKRIYEKHFLVPLHPLNNIDITNYFNYVSRFNGVFSRNNYQE